MKLLTVNNPKILKGEKGGYMTAALHLAPAALSGHEVCPMATEGCRAACLNTAGRGGLRKGGRIGYADILAGELNRVQQSRINRTRFLFKDRYGFMRQLVKEIAAFVRKAGRAGLKPAIRLNATSDIRWEARAFWTTRGSIFDMFPDVQFYDYTKLPNRKNIPDNYHLTFSLADGNWPQAQLALLNGFNVAAVFRDKATRSHFMVTDFMGKPVIDGDETDLRFTDPKGCIVGLYAKGDARKDTSGFVVDMPPLCDAPVRMEAALAD